MVLLNLNLDFRFLKRRLFTPLPLATRFEILSRGVKKYRPDLITFQEIPDAFPLKKLKKVFVGFDFVHDGGIKIAGGVISLYKREDWQLLSKEFTEFSDQGKFFSKQLADRILRKGILTCVLKQRQSKKKILLVNVHLTANYGQKLLDEERQLLKIQLKEIRGLVKRYKLHREIVAGDFNANFQGKTVQNWLRRVGFTPVFDKGKCTVCPGKNPLCHRDQLKDYQIDNVLTHGFKKVSGKLVFNRAGQYVSDHYGQLVELEF